jgi:NAD(P)-dependent dehydrogenase (short-subunit alcohol dehydrogenase family)
VLTASSAAAHETIDYVRPDATCSALLADLNDPASRNTKKRYQFTKLVSIVLGRKLAKLPAAAEVVVNVANPGLCRTEIFHEAPGWLTKACLVYAWEPEDGAKNVSLLATPLRRDT